MVTEEVAEQFKTLWLKGMPPSAIRNELGLTQNEANNLRRRMSPSGGNKIERVPEPEYASFTMLWYRASDVREFLEGEYGSIDYAWERLGSGQEMNRMRLRKLETEEWVRIDMVDNLFIALGLTLSMWDKEPIVGPWNGKHPKEAA